MKKIYIYFTSILLITLFTNTVFAKIPENLTCAKRAIVNYYTSGEYEKDVDLVVQDAEQYLQKRIKENYAAYEKANIDNVCENFLRPYR